MKTDNDDKNFEKEQMQQQQKTPQKTNNTSPWNWTAAAIHFIHLVISLMAHTIYVPIYCVKFRNPANK